MDLRIATHTFSAPQDAEGEPSPFFGLPVRLVSHGAMSYAGFDCIVELLCTAEELAERYEATMGGEYTPADIRELHASGWLESSGGRLFVEANFAEQLTELEVEPATRRDTPRAMRAVR